MSIKEPGIGGQAVAVQQTAAAMSPLRAPGFAGREREVALLGRALDGPPGVILVEGEAGIGKTRLIQELLASPAGRARTALVACCPPYRQPHTVGPLADALRRAADGAVAGMQLSALAGALRPLFPEWCAVLPPAPEPAGRVRGVR